MKKKDKKSLLKFQRFTIANLHDKRNSIRGGGLLTDEDRVTWFRTTCFHCIDNDDNEIK